MGKNKKKTQAEISQSWIDKDIFKHRYLFFSTLEEDNFNLYKAAITHFTNLNNLFYQDTKKNENDDETINYMQDYLKFIEDLAEQERLNEKRYLDTQINYLNKHRKDFPMYEKQIDRILDTYQDYSKDFDYLGMIDLLNLLRTSQDEYDKTLNRITNFLKDQQNNPIDIDKVETRIVDDKEYTMTIKDWYINKYNEYQKIYHEYYKDSEIVPQLTDTVNQRLNEQIEDVFQDLATNNQLEGILSSKYGLGGAQAANAVKALVIQTAFNNLKADTGKLRELIENFLESGKDIDKLDIANIFKTGKQLNYSIEQLALEDGNQLANYFIGLSDDNKLSLLAYFEDKNITFSKKINKIIDTVIKKKDISTGQKAALTRALKNAIIERYSKINNDDNIIDNLKKKTGEAKKQYIEQLLQNTQQHLRSTLNQNISCSIAGPASIAEIGADPQVTNILKDLFSSHIMGTNVQLKNDVVFNFKILPPDYQFSSITNNFLKRLDNFMPLFMKNYNRIAKGATDYSAAKKVYKGMLKSLARDYQTIIDQFGEDSEESQKLIETIETSFFGGVTVKEYEFYNNDIGFKEGSLGSSYSAVAAVESIIKLYDAGGLSHPDINLIIEAILNSNPETMIAPQTGVVETVKNFLIAGAAIAIFDEGFANTKPMLDFYKKIFKKTKGPGHLHLYHVMNLYVPASYVLQNIYENLIKLTQSITERMTSEKVHSSIEIFNNIDYANYQGQLDGEDSAYKWNYMSKEAENNVKIHVLFLAGILDILENLQPIFNDPIN